MDLDLIRAALATPTPEQPLPDHIDLAYARRAAVAAVFWPGPSGTELLMIKRAQQDGDPWSGHMAFPGGAHEPDDADLLETAIRETREEVELDLGGAELLGRLQPITSPRVDELRRKQVVVQPWVFALPGGARPALRPNVEVASAHWFAGGRLLRGEGRGTFPYTWREHTWQVPRVDLDGCRIWGMSLRMIDDLLERVRAL